MYFESADHSGPPLGPVLGIAVFGPKDTGSVTPSRIIAGPSTPFGRSFGYSAITTDSRGNFYLAGYRPREDALYTFGVYEFRSKADGDAAPLRQITTPGLDGSSWDGTGVAMDSAGKHLC